MQKYNFLQGTIAPVILKLLAENKKMYGYEITQKVKSVTDGKIKLTFGAIYPILHKLKKQGLVKTESAITKNRHRVYYSLTEKGENAAKEHIAELKEFIEALKILISPDPGFQGRLT